MSPRQSRATKGLGAVVVFGGLFLLATLSCHTSETEVLLRHPQALVDSVLARYATTTRGYEADLQVIVPMDHKHGFFPGHLVVSGKDSAVIRVERNRLQWVKVTPESILVKRLPGKPLVLIRSNVNHEPVLERELYVLLPDIFSWLLDTYSIRRVRWAPDTGFCVIAVPRKSFSSLSRIEIDVEAGTFRVREVRLYSKSGDLGGQFRYHAFTRRYGYWIPRSVAVDFVSGGETYDELYRLHRVRRLSAGAPSARRAAARTT